ncbi:hypothetical protein [Microbispora bryophytorum]|nr:hypothetical protein [Microbispora bryophytorum]MBD3138248.1 hypothetical protein [Microbispora bryophytorum]TQS04000.1 hypothetical protein FLX07_22675 [Microbispora bryophytorum]
MANSFPPEDLPMQDPPTDPTGEQFREAFRGFAAAAPGAHEIMPGTPNSGMISGGTVPTDRSEHQREPAWPEIPPAWPEVPPPSSFTPTVRSFVEGAPQQPADATATMAGPVPGTAPQQPFTAFGAPDRSRTTPHFGPPPDGFRNADGFNGAGGVGGAENFNGADGFGGPAPTYGMPGPAHPGQDQGHQDQSRHQGQGPGQGQGQAQGLSQGQGLGQAQGQGLGQAGPHAGQFPGGPDRPRPAAPFTPSVRSFAESAPPASATPPQPQPQPEDPYRPFVTAGQISGPKTPPAHRQQELWNTVFGENYQAIDEYEDDESGRPVWLYALVASVVAALVGVLVWAFAAGPLSSGDAAEAATSAKPSPANSHATTKPQTQTSSRLPVYRGTASPVNGVLTDTAGRITLPKLGGPWQADADPAQTKATYGFTSRQYVPAGMTTKGKREFAVVMSGPLSQSLAAKYTTPGNLGPVVNAVMYRARQTQFPKDNKIAKVAQQRLTRNNLTGLAAAYKVTADGATTTVVIAAVNTGADLPTIVYMAVPELKNDLLPDVNTVFRSIKPLG